MPAIFISHSSVNKPLAADIRATLTRLGFEHSFLDYDIALAEDWERRLYEELSRCHAVLLVLTPAWFASKWCFAELVQSRALGKLILPVRCAPLERDAVLPEVQSIDLTDWNADGLRRLEERLRAISDELARGFELDRDRPPYPGIHAFEEADAAIYFGRDEESRAAIERLDARRTHGGAHFVVIIGASGSGKSSLLKASVLPLLKRRRAQWVVLPHIRPEKAPMEALAKALAEFSGKPEAWRAWYQKLNGADALSAIESFVQDTRIGEAKSATVLLPIDQFEEVFTTTPAAERTAFLKLLQDVFARGAPFLVVATGRSDVLEGLIESSELVGHYETFPLTAMPLERYPRLIEGPAAVAGITIEKGLSERIGRDVESREALPLLAHMLALLYQRGGADKKLSLAEYELLGDAAEGLNPIQNSIRLAADDAIAGVKPNAEEESALRDAFLQLVRVRLDDGKRVRQTARRSDLPPASHRLIDALTEARLLTTRSEIGQQTPLVEVTHESLFKSWRKLDTWLTEEQAFLTDLERIRDAHENWLKAPDDQKDGERLYGLLLSRARDWLLKYPRRFVSRDMEPLRAFIADSAKIADAVHARQRLIRYAAFAILGIAVLGFAAFGFYSRQLYLDAEVATQEATRQRGVAQDEKASAEAARDNAELAERKASEAAMDAFKERNRAEEQARLAIEQRNQALITQSRFLADQALQAHNKGDHASAVALALEALPDTKRGIERPYVAAAESMLYQSVVALRDRMLIEGGEFHRAQFSPDRRRIVVERRSDPPLVFDAADGRKIAALDSCPAGSGTPALSPDGKYVATPCNDSIVRISLTETGAPVRELPHKEAVGPVIYSPDGRFVATASEDNVVRLWPASENGPPRALDHGRRVESIVFSPDHRQIAVTSSDGLVHVWKLDDNSPPVTFDKKLSIMTAAFIPEGLRIATWQSDDDYVRIWDGETEMAALRHPRAIGAELSKDGRRILTYEFGSQVVRVWELGSSIKAPGPAESRPIIDLQDDGEVDSARFSPDGELVLVVLREKSAHLWNVGRRQKIAEFGVHARSIDRIDFSFDGRLAVTVSVDSVRIWDATDGGPARVLGGHENTIYSASFSPGGERLVTTSQDQTARVWDTATGAELAKLDHPAAVRSAVFLSDGRTVVTGGQDGVLRVWDVVTKTATEYPQNLGIILSIVPSSDGQRLVVGYQHNAIHLWEPTTRKAGVALDPFPGPVRKAVDARNGQRIVAAEATNIWLYDAANGKPQRLEKTGGGGIPAIALAPDGKYIAIGNADGRLTILDADDASHPVVAEWQAHQGKIEHVRFAGNGRRIVTASEDGTARVWDNVPKDAVELAVLTGHKLKVTAAAFSPDERRIVTVSPDQTARIWPAFPTTQDLIEYARTVLPRPLSAEARKRYFLEDSASVAAAAMPKQ